MCSLPQLLRVGSIFSATRIWLTSISWLVLLLDGSWQKFFHLFCLVSEHQWNILSICPPCLYFVAQQAGFSRGEVTDDEMHQNRQQAVMVWRWNLLRMISKQTGYFVLFKLYVQDIFRHFGWGEPRFIGVQTGRATERIPPPAQTVQQMS